MSRFDEHLFGRLAVFNGYLTQEQLQECLDYQRSLDPADRRPIGEILLEREYIDEDQLEIILDIRRKKLRKMLLDSRDLVSTERAFGQQALGQGFITQDQLEQALLEQQRLRRLNLQLCLGDIMISKGFMNIKQVLEVLALQKSRILFCGDCDLHYTIFSFRQDSEYYCKHCNRVLQVPLFLDTVATDGTIGGEDTVEIEVEESTVTEA